MIWLAVVLGGEAALPFDTLRVVPVIGLALVAFPFAILFLTFVVSGFAAGEAIYPSPPETDVQP